MSRAVLEALIPSFVALAIAFVLLRGVVRVSGARLKMARLKRIHRCEVGAVQSLSFVLTLPLFIMLVMFIVQVSQLMIGIMGVHYAAFAAARSASVWTAAQSNPGSGFLDEEENRLLPPLSEDFPVLITFDGHEVTQEELGVAQSWKLNKIFAAAVAGLAPVSPSRTLVTGASVANAGVEPGLVVDMYRQLVPESAGSSKVVDRLWNKFSYAYWNMTVEVSFLDKDTEEGPTYNPRVLRIVDGMPVQDENGEWQRVWVPNEIGWQDPMQIAVAFDFALLPGPGRFLAKYIVAPDQQSDRVSSRVRVRGERSDQVPWTSPAYTTRIVASATLTNEGFKPLLSYEQDLD